MGRLFGRLECSGSRVLAHTELIAVIGDLGLPAEAGCEGGEFTFKDWSMSTLIF